MVSVAGFILGVYTLTVAVLLVKILQLMFRTELIYRAIERGRKK